MAEITVRLNRREQDALLNAQRKGYQFASKALLSADFKVRQAIAHHQATPHA